MDVKRLNHDYGLPGQLEFNQGKGGFTFVTVSNRSATALISLYGGQVLSFRPVDDLKDILFLSKMAQFEQGRAIRGGIPICWPWFGQDPENLHRPNHGFARTQHWSVVGTEAISAFETRLTVSLLATSESRSVWPYEFELMLDITVARELNLELVTRNVSRKPFVLSQAFHPYLKIGHIDHVQLHGLDKCRFIDRLAKDKEKIQYGPLNFEEEVERIFTSVRNEQIIDDALLNRRIRITSLDSEQIVVWNPWVEKSAGMPDLNAGDYQHFLCIEPGHVANGAIEVQPDSECQLTVRFEIIRR